MSTDLTVRAARWQRDRDTLKALRHQVFVVEQNVPLALEWDGEDANCRHALAFIDGQAVGTGRLTADGQIGRMAVLEAARGQGVGAAILNELITLARADGLSTVYLHAQVHARRFYERAGFVADGPVFAEAGIDHVNMTLAVDRAEVPPANGNGRH